MPEQWRLQVLYWHESVPSSDAIRSAVLECPGVAQAWRAVKTADSARAERWRRDPMALDPSGRIALAFTRLPDDDTVGKLARVLNGSMYVCRTLTPLDPAIASGETHNGTLQLCCFKRQPELSDQALTEYWLAQHTPVALETQSTRGYVQNRVLTTGEPAFDGIVEEYFPAEAATSPAHFFDAVDDPVKLNNNVARMMTSSSRFIDFDTALVIHLTDTRVM